jgi:hypothetical protein
MLCHTVWKKVTDISQVITASIIRPHSLDKGSSRQVLNIGQFPPDCTPHVRFQVLMAASMKFRVFCDVAPCSQFGADRRFRGEYCLNHQALIALMMEIVYTSE